MAEKFHLEITSPDGKRYQNEVEMLNLTLTDGAIGILKNHTPLIGIIEVSQMNFIKDGKTYWYAISGGVLNVTKDETLILADSFEAQDEIDFERAEKAKKRAQDKISRAKEDSNIDIKRAELALKKAINRIGLSGLK